MQTTWPRSPISPYPPTSYETTALISSDAGASRALTLPIRRLARLVRSVVSSLPTDQPGADPTYNSSKEVASPCLPCFILPLSIGVEFSRAATSACEG